MVRHKQPRPLYRICHQRFCEYLGERVVKAGGGYDSSGIKYTPIYYFSLNKN